MSLSDKDIDEIIAELNINDIYYMLYIASRWFDRMKKTEYLMRRIANQLGVGGRYGSGEDLVKAMIKEELSRALNLRTGEESIEIEETPETRERLRKVIDMIKSKKQKKAEEESKEKAKEEAEEKTG
jgi:ribosomal protein L30/L7E